MLLLVVFSLLLQNDRASSWSHLVFITPLLLFGFFQKLQCGISKSLFDARFFKRAVQLYQLAMHMNKYTFLGGR